MDDRCLVMFVHEGEMERTFFRFWFATSDDANIYTWYGEYMCKHITE